MKSGTATHFAKSVAVPNLLGLAILAGVLLGCAFPPVDWKGLVWVGLAPLLWALMHCQRLRVAFLLGYLAGLVFFLLTLYPLVSVHTWAGWMVETPAQFAGRMNRQWWFMHGIWAGFALWCALFWGLWAMVVKRLGTSPWRLLIVAPSAWLLFPEWVRAQTTFGFTWAFLANATADLVAIRQLATVGGVWILSALVVMVNVAIASLFRKASRWRIIALVGALVGVAWGWGSAVPLPVPSVPGTQGTGIAAAVQHHRLQYVPNDFSAIGLDQAYLQVIPEALKREARLIVLPESIALGAISLDGSASHMKPPSAQVARAQWDTTMQNLLAGTQATLIAGLDTIEDGADYNTLVAWTADGPAGWYHKRRLVPFSEYHPWGWGTWALRGRSQYSFGHGSQLIREQGMALGGFICQEVLFPWVTRESVRDGATVLVSGGNDGVFGSLAVAQVHADAAQLRAVETGRYLIRAMKTGITAIIDPHGQELGRSRSSESVLVMRPIAPQHSQTPYVRFGDWFLWLATLIILSITWRDRRWLTRKIR